MPSRTGCCTPVSYTTRAYDTSGNKIWSANYFQGATGAALTGAFVSCQAIDSSQVYVVGSRMTVSGTSWNLVCFDIVTGSTQWVRDLFADIGSPSTYDFPPIQVLIDLSGNIVVMLDAVSGGSTSARTQWFVTVDTTGALVSVKSFTLDVFSGATVRPVGFTINSSGDYHILGGVSGVGTYMYEWLSPFSSTVTTYNSGSGTHTFSTKGTAVVEGWGGGAGSDDSTGGVNSASNGAQSGGYFKKTLTVAASDTATYAVGAAGAGGGGGGAGTNGGNTTFTKGTTYTANGGSHTGSGAGTASNGDTNTTGASGSAPSGNTGGNGGNAPGSGGTGGTGGTNGADGGVGNAPGAGAGGAGSSGNGAAGGAGRIKVTLTPITLINYQTAGGTASYTTIVRGILRQGNRDYVWGDAGGNGMPSLLRGKSQTAAPAKWDDFDKVLPTKRTLTAVNVTATGATQGTAAALTTNTSVTFLVGSSTHGAILPSATTDDYVQITATSGTVTIYPPVGGQIYSGGVSLGTNVGTTVNANDIYVAINSTDWVLWSRGSGDSLWGLFVDSSGNVSVCAGSTNNRRDIVQLDSSWHIVFYVEAISYWTTMDASLNVYAEGTRSSANTNVSLQKRDSTGAYQWGHKHMGVNSNISRNSLINFDAPDSQVIVSGTLDTGSPGGPIPTSSDSNFVTPVSP